MKETHHESTSEWDVDNRRACAGWHLHGHGERAGEGGRKLHSALRGKVGECCFAARELYLFRSLSKLGKRRSLPRDRKSTRLNSSHPSISYAVFCLKKKKHV